MNEKANALGYPYLGKTSIDFRQGVYQYIDIYLYIYIQYIHQLCLTGIQDEQQREMTVVSSILYSPHVCGRGIGKGLLAESSKSSRAALKSAKTDRAQEMLEDQLHKSCALLAKRVE